MNINHEFLLLVVQAFGVFGSSTFTSKVQLTIARLEKWRMEYFLAGA
jgi:hypothetical protein